MTATKKATIEGEVKYFPYRTAQVQERFLTLDRDLLKDLDG